MEKVFRDPVHNYINVNSPIISALIDTAEFQRLRRIKQLGTSSFTFHGAEHTRFSHCLGVYHIAKKITDYFSMNFPLEWNPDENLLTQCAALLHDVGHGAYSHTFEGLFGTDHEAVTREIITSEETEVNAILRQVSPDFPEKVASVISHEYANPQVVQLISSQIDADRMDYLLRDAYYTGAVYGQFDLTRILRVMVPTENGIAFKYSGMHAVEDYIVSRYQMYMQVYFHAASRSMEVLLQKMLARAKFLYAQCPDYFATSSPCLVPFFEKNHNLKNYLRLDDGVMNTYFQTWMEHEDKILSDLATAYINRHLLKSIKFDRNSIKENELDVLSQLVNEAGFDPAYYTGIHSNYDLPYDFYRPSSSKPRTQIEILQKDGELTELSMLSPLIQSLTGTIHGNSRFYFPKVMLENPEFTKHIKNDTFVSTNGVISTILD
ncbi:HD domain-containing protein [Lactococcus allomyrinae]|uniref:HD domain-containing protein n=1 Tax=Lactococcus allomyrinae TaxID=2419773 RepID=A0A387BGT3_9LACT|nr:HD domain-containing protein [Lactococcus allomyrinae]AYG00227.1 HD domain-containing protein [Lactococcus allomyrinae]